MINCLHGQAIDTIFVGPDWNLLSLPLKVIDGTTIALFPTAVSEAYVYKSSYIGEDTLENGYGFWLKFDTTDTIQVTGDLIGEDFIEVYKGWNIIGSLSTPVSVDSISSTPDGIIISEYFGYLAGCGKMYDY